VWRYSYLAPVVWRCCDEPWKGIVEGQSTQTNVESERCNDPEDGRDEEVREGQELHIVSIVWHGAKSASREDG